MNITEAKKAIGRLYRKDFPREIQLIRVSEVMDVIEALEKSVREQIRIGIASEAINHSDYIEGRINALKEVLGEEK